MNDIRSLIPQHKKDFERTRAVIAAGYPAVEPILPELLAWLQDCNWPVAQGLAPFLASIGEPLVPHIQHVMGTDDDIWKYWMITMLMAESPEIAGAFREELERLAFAPTEREKSEELDDVARDALQEHGWYGGSGSDTP